MVTKERILELCSQHELDFTFPVKYNSFIDGLLILHSLSNTETDYAAGHDEFFAAVLSDLPNITETDVINLRKLGWHFDRSYDCFAKFV